jgi:hypothetical protein
MGSSVFSHTYSKQNNGMAVVNHSVIVAKNNHNLAIPADSVTACCSAIPTSKARSGKASIMNFKELLRAWRV